MSEVNKKHCELFCRKANISNFNKNGACPCMNCDGKRPCNRCDVYLKDKKYAYDSICRMCLDFVSGTQQTR